MKVDQLALTGILTVSILYLPGLSYLWLYYTTFTSCFCTFCFRNIRICIETIRATFVEPTILLVCTTDTIEALPIIHSTHNINQTDYYSTYIACTVFGLSSVIKQTNAVSYIKIYYYIQNDINLLWCSAVKVRTKLNGVTLSQ